jgi:lysophosphatidic acid acyltransferase/lysophosphatidylinositol acyltransferase
MEYYLTDCCDQVVTSWACLLISGALKFLQRSSLLSSRKGIAFAMSSLAVVTLLMYILIRFSQSERSTTAKVAAAKPKYEGKPSETGDDK